MMANILEIISSSKSANYRFNKVLGGFCMVFSFSALIISPKFLQKALSVDLTLSGVLTSSLIL